MVRFLRVHFPVVFAGYCSPTRPCGVRSVVQPNASEALIEEAILINENPAYVPERNLFVVVKDLSKRHALFSCSGQRQNL